MIGERLNLGPVSALSFVLLLASAGCDASPPPPGRDGGGGDGGGVSMCIRGLTGSRCMGAVAIECLEDGSEGASTNCAAMGQVCVEGTGCTLCRPNAFQCSGDTVQRCNAAGTAWETSATCDPTMGQMCNSVVGACTSACDDAAASNSYIGCEYWPTPTANFVADDFDFAVVVANPQSAPATVTVTRGGSNVATVTVPADGLETIRLPWVDGYKVPLNTMTGATFSSLVRGGAYRLVSTLPVTVYQFNPLEFRIARDCAGERTLPDNECFSFSNDASLLLPSHVMTGNYIAVSERTLTTRCPAVGGVPEAINSTPGFVTIVGVEPSPVTVSVQLRGYTAASEDGAVSAGIPGSTQMFTLNQGDVLQLASGSVSTCAPNGTTADQCVYGTLFPSYQDITHCAVPDDYDLTGTEIRATGRVMVIGGHTCAFLPTNRFACDHIEETVFPLETWGRDFLVGASESIRGEPNIVRVLSGTDGNMITFDPASAHAPVTLSRGQTVEFESGSDFRVVGSGPILVSQYLVGQNYSGAVAADSVGDPAMSFAIPTEQFRSDYTFLAPATFTQSYVNVTAPMGATVTLDGAPVAGFEAIGGTGFGVARVPISGGQHNITGGQPFGIVVYGYARYTSYMYPGGLNFEDINPLI